MTRRLVALDGLELCVEDFGDPARPTVLLVSGAAASMDWWYDELCARIAEGGRHVVRYDHRDTGESTTDPPGAPTYGGWQLGDDCAALIKTLDVGPVHLVGVSMGGGIAQMVALRHRDRVATLTLIATSPVGGVEADLPGPTLGVSVTFQNPPPEPDWADVASYADWTVASARPYSGSIALDEARTLAIAADVHARSHDPASAGNHWLVVGADDEAGEGDDEDDDEPLDVRRITAPTLVVHGSDDPLFPLPHGRALADAIPGSTWLELPGMGHEVPPPTTWAAFVPALLEHTARR